MDNGSHRHRHHLHGRPDEEAHAPLPLFAGNPPLDYHMGPVPDPYPPPPPPNLSIYPPPPAVTPVPYYPPVVFDEMSNRPTVRMFCKADSNYSLAVRDGHVILARSNPSDISQHWIKDEKLSTMVKDEEGLQIFALINKATGEAMKHSFGEVDSLRVNRFCGVRAKTWGVGTYRAIRMVNNIRLNVSAFNGDNKRDGVHDGTKIVLGEWKRGDNQRWRIVPYVEKRSVVADQSKN